MIIFHTYIFVCCQWRAGSLLPHPRLSPPSRSPRCDQPWLCATRLTQRPLPSWGTGGRTPPAASGRSEPVAAGSATQPLSRQAEEPCLRESTKEELLRQEGNGGGKSCGGGDPTAPPPPHHLSEWRQGSCDQGEGRRGVGFKLSLGRARKGIYCSGFFPLSTQIGDQKFMFIFNIGNVRNSEEIMLKILWYSFIIITVPLSGLFFPLKKQKCESSWQGSALTAFLCCWGRAWHWALTGEPSCGAQRILCPYFIWLNSYF